MNMNMNMNMRKSQSGFTLIELVIVIVILGILAAVAVPRFINLSDEAEQAAVAGVAGSLSSAFAINFAGCAASSFAAGANCVAVTNCSDGADVLVGGVPAGYTITAAALTFSQGTNCTVAIDDGPSATFQGIGTVSPP